MAASVVERIEALESSREQVSPEDTIAEAGRKILLGEFTKMLKHEAGSRSGENIEDVHDMRVAIRRSRSLFRLLKPYFKSKDVRGFNRALRALADALGEVRDLDVLITDLTAFQTTLDADGQAVLQKTLDALYKRRAEARGKLVDLFDSKGYRRFLKAYVDFVSQPLEAGKQSSGGAVIPHEVRHVLPGLIHERLAAVRAYERALEAADPVTLHALRIEFKRLRYALTLFEDVLGSQIGEFIDEIKQIQDTLGHLNDGDTARAQLDGVLDDDAVPEALAAYLAHLETNDTTHRAGFAEAWARFNTRKVQQKLSSSLLSLR